jgi:taurine transport system permease protein
VRKLLTNASIRRQRSYARSVASARRSVTPRRIFNVRWLSVLSVLLALSAWALLPSLRIVPSDLLPEPWVVASTFLDILRNGYRGTTLWQNAFATLYRCGLGFILACMTGIPLGLLMGRNAKVGAAFDYIIQFMRPLPPLSYLILLILWLGTGDMSKIALLYLTAFPIVVSSAMAGVRTVAIQKIQVARSLGAREWQIFRHVIFPAALPMIFTGTRIALAVAFSTVVAAELMAASDGLGWMVFSASHFLRNDVIVLGIIALGILGMVLNWAIMKLDAAIVHWRGVE